MKKLRIFILFYLIPRFVTFKPGWFISLNFILFGIVFFWKCPRLMSTIPTCYNGINIGFWPNMEEGQELFKYNKYILLRSYSL